MTAPVFAKNTRSGSVLAIAGGKSGGALQNGLQILQTDFVAGTGKECVLDNGVLDVVLAQFLSELGVVLGVNALVLDDQTCDGVLESFGKLCNDRFLLL